MQLKQSSHLLIVLALMLVMGALLIPGKAYAHTDHSPHEEDLLTIDNVKLSGDILSFTVTDKETGLIQELELNILDYYDLYSEYISIEVQNHNGKKTQAFQIRNPYFAEGFEPPEVEEVPEIPDIPSEPNPFTPDGTGTVLDNAEGREGKEFFTVETPDGNIFYLVIDRHRSAENVYLLNAVTEKDLMALAEIEEDEVVVTPAPPVETPAPEPIVPNEPDVVTEPDKSGNNNTLIFIIIAVVIVGGAGYYFKVVKPKQNADMYDDDEEDDEDETDDEEEMNVDDDE